METNAKELMEKILENYLEIMKSGDGRMCFSIICTLTQAIADVCEVRPEEILDSVKELMVEYPIKEMEEN